MDVTNLTDLEFLMCLFDSRIRPIVVKNLGILQTIYQESFHKELFKCFENDDVIELDIKFLMNNAGLSDNVKNECLKVLSTVFSGNLTDTTCGLVKTKLYNMICKQKIILVQRDAKTPAELVEAIKAIEIDFTDSKVDTRKIIRSVNFKDIDIKEVRDSLGAPWKSSSESMNKCFTIGGYMKSQLVQVVGGTGSGKSMWMMNEVISFLKQGARVCYFAIGDLIELDFVTRLPAILLNKPLDYVYKNLDVCTSECMTRYRKELDNLKLLFVSPGTATVDDLMHYLRISGYEEQFDVFIFDYDSNIQSELDMYHKGGETYDRLCALSRSKLGNPKLVFVLSQPKTMYLDAEIIPLDGANESSKKQQVIDVMITIGKNRQSVNNIGFINLPKIRRGGITSHFRYWMGVTGIFQDIDNATYQALMKADSLKVLGSSGVSEKQAEEIENIINGKSKEGSKP